MPSRPGPLVPRLMVVAIACAAGASAYGSSPSSSTSPGLQGDGRALMGALGCGGCHAGGELPTAAREAAPPLGPDAAPLPASFVFEYLADPRPRRPDIAPSRMPLFDLSETERVALALYLGRASDGSGPSVEALARARAAAPGTDEREGRRLFGALGCGGCHANPDAPPTASAPDLSVEGARVRPDWLRGYLARPVPVRPSGDPFGSGSRMPDFRLAPAEVEAIAAHLLRDAPDESATPVHEPLTPGRTRRAEWLLAERTACLGCHRLAGEGGRLGPPLDGLAARLRPAWVRAVISDPERAAPGGSMPDQPLSQADADLLARYLLEDDAPWTAPDPVRVAGPTAWSAASAGGIDPAGPAATDAGAALYARWCAACHGAGGGGDGWNAASLPVPPTRHADPSVMAPRADDTLYDAIHAGGWVLEQSPRMPAFGAALTPSQIEALVAYIRRLCDCLGPAWSRDGGRR